MNRYSKAAVIFFMGSFTFGSLYMFYFNTVGNDFSITDRQNHNYQSVSAYPPNVAYSTIPKHRIRVDITSPVDVHLDDLGLKDLIPKAPQNYVLEIHTFISKNSAKRLVKQLIEKGFQAHYTSVRNGQDVRYLVRVGFFQTNHDVDVAKNKVIAMGYTPLIKIIN